MATVVFSDRAIADLLRVSEFVRDASPMGDTIALIEEALEILERHPLLGRPAGDGLRELVVSRGRTGYVALYEFLERPDLVVVHAVRHQRETGFDE